MAQTNNYSILLILITTLVHLQILTSAAVPLACDPNDPRSGGFLFCRTSLPMETRVRDLVNRLTVQEKVLLLVNNAAPVPRLGIRRNEWWSEALHGVAISPGVKFSGGYPGATSFPQVITTAASFNSSLWVAIGTVVSDEARAMYNGGAAGLTFWSPNVNIFRDPRWGRGQETPGEDPTVAAKYATSYVRGLQGDGNGGRLKVAACCKHYTAYDVDNWNGVDRFHFNALVSPQDLADTYNVPFEACVRDGRVASVMCSYNQVNGKPTCADTHLLRNTIRRDWQLNGYIVSDCDSVGVLYDNQHYTKTPEEAVADVLKAGLDLDCGPFLAFHTENALQKGLIRESDINSALSNNIRVQMRLGMFDGNQQPYGFLGPRDVCSPAHQQLALEAAHQGIVLLKNDNRALPLDSNRHRLVAVIGPNSDATAAMIANYQGVPCSYTTPLQGISRYTRAVHQQGCKGVACSDTSGFQIAMVAARHTDATVLVMGLDQSIEAEFKDRASVLLPGHQQELISRVAMASKGPTILVLMCGGPVDVSFAKNDPKISAILWVGYPGQAGGAAIADVLFGAHNPGGKLPNTWYPQSYVAKLPMTNMNMRANRAAGYPGRTYRFYKGPTVFPFGFGLSYTSFKHSLPQSTTKTISIPLLSTSTLQTSYYTETGNTTNAVNINHADCQNSTPLTLHVDVHNTGDMDGAHTVFVYSTHGTEKRLVAFEKVHVRAGSTERVRVDAHLCKHLSYVDEYGVRRVHIGEHKLHIGEIKHTVTVTMG